MCSFFHLVVAAAVTVSASMAFASDGPGGKSACGGGCMVRCPNCCHECVFSADKEKVTKSCYGVECKDICIPRIVFPWQKGRCTCGKGGKDGCCAVHTGVKKRSVRVLKKYEYECSHCKYQWTPVDDKNGYKDGGMKDKMLVPEAMPADDVAVPPPPPVSAEHRSQQPSVRVVIR